MLVDFTGKNAKLEREICIQLKLDSVETKCAAGNHNYMCHTCAKEFLNLNFNYAVIDKISNFHDIAPNSTYSHKS